jgi:bile acid:sodium symporter
MNFAAIYQPLLIIAAALAGIGLEYMTPFCEIASHIITPALMALLYIVFLSTDGSELRAAFQNVRFTLTATAVNFLWTPVFSYGLGLLFFRENIDMQLGLMMLLVTPCTDWYLVFMAQARGNTVLGASILPLNLALQILLLPVDLALFYGDAIRITDAEVVRSALVVLLLPLGLAACSNALGRISPLMARSIAHLRTWGDALQLGFLMTAVLAMFASESAVLFAHSKPFADMLLVMLIFFSVNYVLVRQLGVRLGFRRADLTALSFTTLARNSPLALAIAAGAFPDRPLTILALIIGPLIELPILALIAQRIRKTQTHE